MVSKLQTDDVAGTHPGVMPKAAAVSSSSLVGQLVSNNQLVCSVMQPADVPATVGLHRGATHGGAPVFGQGQKLAGVLVSGLMHPLLHA